MWPFDRRTTFIVAGRHRAERWTDERTGFAHLASQPIAFDGSQRAASLSDVIRKLLAAGTNERSRGPVHVILESAWLPVFRLDLDASLWSGPKLRALLRHRLALHHGAEGADESELMIDYRPGETMAWGFALPRPVKQAVLAGAADTGHSVTSIQPSFAWGIDRWMGKQVGRGTGWWLWLEQDRSLVGHVADGRIAAFNPGAARIDDAAGWQRLRRTESVRLGVDGADQRACIGGWLTSESSLRPGGMEFDFVGPGLSASMALGTLRGVQA